MSFDTTDDPLRFEEAVRFFRERVPMTREEFALLTGEARLRAFIVSGVAQLDLVAEVAAQIETAIVAGTTLEAFRERVEASLLAAWAGTVADPPWRIETIFRTNVQAAYAHGRVEQALEVADERPFWRFSAVGDDRTTAICKACDGTILPVTDAWWQTHTPPLHFNCRSIIETLSAEEAASAGIARKRPAMEPGAGFGAQIPLDDIEPLRPAANDYPPDLWRTYQTKR